MFNVGDRVGLVLVPNEPNPVPTGTKGTVMSFGGQVQGRTQFSVQWDNGRTLALVMPPDVAVKIELEAPDEDEFDGEGRDIGQLEGLGGEQ